MSLFPAYSQEALKPYYTSDEIKFTEENFSFSSFKPIAEALESHAEAAKASTEATKSHTENSDNETSNFGKASNFKSKSLKENPESKDSNYSSSDSEYERKKLKKHKTSKKSSKSKHKKSSKRKEKYEDCSDKDNYKRMKLKQQTLDLNLKSKDNDLFEISSKRCPELLNVDRIYRPAAPKCHVKYNLNKTKDKRWIRRKFKRYYKIHWPENSETEQNNRITKADLKIATNLLVPQDENYTGFKHEENLTQTTAAFNRTLQENPSDINTWLQYTQFQDTVFQFEKSYRKGSIAKGLRVTADRKLSILDKALQHNPDCERLLRERLNIAASVYPSDELQNQLEKLVEKDQANIILWQGYIESKQCSMSHCSTPKVLRLYTKCLSTLHKLRRSAKLEKHVLEEYILRMLYQCGLFLRQAGLFEQLWTLLKLYLELNLSKNTSSESSAGNFINPSVQFNEKQLLDLEEVILNSQLPIHELWLRIEKLRESCHFLPCIESESCEDPQRLVFSEDVTELIHPITMPQNTFKMVATILTLLKVPLLPCRHTTMSELGLDYVPWSLDSIETLLSVFLPPISIELNLDLLKYLQKLIVGPQYLRVLPCQEEYLEFVLKVMQNCAERLLNDEKNVIIIWWFRFVRLLAGLERNNLIKITEGFKKKLKGLVKNVLKKDEFRNNPIFFHEYALFELVSSGRDSCVKILLTTIEMNFKSKSVFDLDEDLKAAHSMVFRSLIEVSLDDKEKALNYLSIYIIGNENSSVQEVELKFRHIYLGLMSQIQGRKISIIEHFKPNFFTNFVILNGLFLYLTKGTIEAGVFLEKTLDDLNEKFSNENEKSNNINENTFGTLNWEKEVLYEFYTTLLFKESSLKPGKGIFKILNDVVYRAIEKYPNNLYLLSILLKEHTFNRSLSQNWWKIKSMLLKTGRVLPILFLVLILYQQVNQIEQTFKDTITGQEIVADSNVKNRMLALFRQITSREMCTKRCGLVWRLYLQFLHQYFDLKKCRDTYYAAVEELPWLKALYIDAAIYIPGELAQIQDLIIEKELRIHVTPEELDILRS